MARWTQTWLSGLGATDVGAARAVVPGARLGLPGTGPRSVAPFGRRAGAFAVDAVLSSLVARLLTGNQPLSQTQSLATSLAPVVVLAVAYVLGLALTGQTPGMRLLRLRVVPVAGGRAAPDAPALRLVPAALRTALLLLLVPALVTDADGRGLHDRAGAAVVVRA